MKASDVITQLANELPKSTLSFTASVRVSSLTRSGTVVTVVTAEHHALETGHNVTITGARTAEPLQLITRVKNSIKAATTSPHDLTLGHHEKVTISGADNPEHNGSFPLLTVHNRLEFTYTIPSAVIGIPLGTPVLVEDKRGGYNGRYQIEAINETSFSYEISALPPSPATGNIAAHTAIRVSGGVDIDSIVLAYTKQPKENLWAFVVIEDSNISRDRSTLNDAATLLANTQERRIREIENFSVYVFIPTSESISAMAARDQVDDIAPLLYKSLVGAKLPTNLSAPREYVITPESNTFFAYSKAFYVHRFIFQCARDILAGDMFEPSESVAFRDFGFATLNADTKLQLINVNVDLDERPL